MKTTQQRIIMKAQELKATYGEVNVTLGLQTALAFHYAYSGDFKISFWNQYILISKHNCPDVLEDADLVFDLESGKVIVDARGLIEQSQVESYLEAIV